MTSEPKPTTMPEPETMAEPAEPAPAPDAGPGRMPAIYLGHGAPTLLDDEL